MRLVTMLGVLAILALLVFEEARSLQPPPAHAAPASGSVHICTNSNYGQNLTCMEDTHSVSRADLDAGPSGDAFVIQVPNMSGNPSAVVRLFEVSSDGSTSPNGFSNVSLNQTSTHTDFTLQGIINDALSNAGSSGGDTSLKDGTRYVLRVDYGSEAIFGGEIGTTQFTYHKS